jgi:crossover junction endodeoxyribonuclease RuvC
VGISPREFEQLQKRASRAAAPAIPTLADVRQHSVILGIDPSLRGTGFGVIANVRPQARALTCGTIRCPASWARSRCLAHILTTLRGVIREHAPTACAIEGLFYAQNMQTALIMGEARGASLAAAAEAGLEIFEVAPRKMKQAIVGYGAAQKDAVAKMVQRMLNLATVPDADAADALALALAYAQTNHTISTSAPRRI